jgi:ribosomal protein S18 acetylase RimI-like enzyme
LTGGTITVRAAGRDDLDAVLDLWAEARSEHASSADRRQDIERMVGEFPGALLVAEDERSTVIGAAIAAWDGWRGNIYRLAVDGSRRREGVGRALVEAAELRLHSHGCQRVTALVADSDDVAGPFWDAAGYPRDTRIGRRVKNI